MGSSNPHIRAVPRPLIRLVACAGLLLAKSESQQAREEAASWLILLDDDPDDQEQQASFREWLEKSPAHASAWASVSRTSDVLASAPKPVAPVNIRWAGLKRPGPRAMAGWAIAACLLLVFAPTLLLSVRSDEMTGTAEIRTVKLVDGSVVRLGPRSAIAVSFTDEKRSIALLAGEALFDVGDDPHRPFSVRARDAVITDLGTRFDVGIRHETLDVAVNHGMVRVASSGRSYDLGPGDWLQLSGEGGRTGEGLPEELTSGPSTRIAARNTPVGSVVDELRPWFSGRIIVTDSALGAKAVTGVFDATDPAKALRTIVGPVGGKVTQISPWLLIVSGS